MLAVQVETQFSMSVYAYGMPAHLCDMASHVVVTTINSKLWFSVQAEYVEDFKASQCPRARGPDVWDYSLDKDIA